MKSIRDKVTALKTQEATTAVEQAIDGHANAKALEAMMAIGAIGATNAIASALSARTIRALQKARDTKLHENLGFNRFDDFLDSSQYSPMSYKQFYNREQLLEKEGDEIFDFLNSIQLPMSRRKLLTSGALEIEGDAVVLGEERISLSDKRRIVQTLSELSAKTSALEEKVEKQSKTIAKGKEDVDNWKRKVDEAKSSAVIGDAPTTPFGQALLLVIAGLAQLTDAAKDLSDEELIALRDNALRQIGARQRELHIALGFKDNEIESMPGLSADRAAELLDD